MNWRKRGEASKSHHYVTADGPSLPPEKASLLHFFLAVTSPQYAQLCRAMGRCMDARFKVPPRTKKGKKNRKIKARRVLTALPISNFFVPSLEHGTACDWFPVVLDQHGRQKECTDLRPKQRERKKQESTGKKRKKLSVWKNHRRTNRRLTALSLFQTDLFFLLLQLARRPLFLVPLSLATAKKKNSASSEFRSLCLSLSRIFKSTKGTLCQLS